MKWPRRRPRWHELSLRARLGVLVAVAVAVAVVAVSVVSWSLTRANLYQQFDARLESYAQLAAKATSPADALAQLQETGRRRPDSGPGWDSGLSVQFLAKDGSPAGISGPLPEIPVDPVAQLVVAGSPAAGMSLDHTALGRIRVWTAARPQGGAVQVAQDAEGVEDTLAQLGFWEAVVGLVGVLGAALVGWAVARTALRPVDTLTAAAEEVARTQEIGGGIPVAGQGEIARLAEAFNAMLTTLADSRDAQRRLVEDAGHELRTPLTSLRNNVELLIHADAQTDGTKVLSAEDRSRLLTDLDVQTGELTTLVGELVELSKGDWAPEPDERVDLADLLRSAVERVRPRAPKVRFETEFESAEVLGGPASLERAVLNVLDNAAKWSPAGGAVAVRVAAGDDGTARVVVEDEGPGIAEVDLPHVFERFYRAEAARALPGSGLGLAIVEQVVSRHGGAARAGHAAGGGARFELTLPLAVS